MKMLKKIFFGFSACLFLILSVSFLLLEETHLGLGVLSESEYRQIISARTFKDKNLSSFAQFEKDEIFYDETSDHYLITVGSAAQHFTYDENIRLFWMPQKFDNMDQMIEQDSDFHLIAIWDEYYTEYALHISTLPLIHITQPKPYADIDRAPVPADITVIVPVNEKTGRHEMKKYQCAVNLRGQTAYNMPKKSYEVDLKNSDGEPLHESLLGMRKDDDWALNGAYSENSKIREPMITTLWKEVIAQEANQNIYGFSMKNCEVLLNNTYMGIYQLLEPIDEKQEKIDKINDRLYKYWRWILNSSDDMKAIDAAGGATVSGIKLKNEKTASMENRWGPMITYTEVFLEPDELQQGVCLADAQRVTDMENLIDCSIFLNLFQLMDNNPKNMFYIYRAENEDHHLYRDLWDMNYSFGAYYDNSLEKRCISNVGIMPVEWDIETQRLLNGPDAALFFGQYYARYTQLRETVLTAGHMKELAEQYYQELNSSGAYFRDNLVWTTAPVDGKAEYQNILTYIDAKLEQMDAVITETAKELGIL